jgi:hypothetical protein
VRAVGQLAWQALALAVVLFGRFLFDFAPQPFVGPVDDAVEQGARRDGVAREKWSK